MTNDSDLAVKGMQIVKREILARIARLQECLAHTDELIEMLHSNGRPDNAKPPAPVHGGDKQDSPGSTGHEPYARNGPLAITGGASSTHTFFAQPKPAGH